MITLLLILASNEVVGGGVGVAGGVGLFTWLVKRHLKKRDAKAQETKALLTGILESSHKTQADIGVIKARLDAGDGRMMRIEATQDNQSRDIRQIRNDVTTIRRKTGKRGEEGEV
jgi:hypothetical protein